MSSGFWNRSMEDCPVSSSALQVMLALGINMRNEIMNQKILQIGMARLVVTVAVAVAIQGSAVRSGHRVRGSDGSSVRQRGVGKNWSVDQWSDDGSGDVAASVVEVGGSWVLLHISAGLVGRHGSSET